MGPCRRGHARLRGDRSCLAALLPRRQRHRRQPCATCHARQQVEGLPGSPNGFDLCPLNVLA
jgi:hypothetical protein